jgi:hypothetical protein
MREAYIRRNGFTGPSIHTSTSLREKPHRPPKDRDDLAQHLDHVKQENPTLIEHTGLETLSSKLDGNFVSNGFRGKIARSPPENQNLIYSETKLIDN